MKDFFISYNNADRPWAEWIAWQLEEAGYTTIIQAWDFLAGSNFVQWMNLATSLTERTIAVLSKSYLAARFTHPEWGAAFSKDPLGKKSALLPVRVNDCEPTGLLGSIIHIDLIGRTEEEAKTVLLGMIHPLFAGTPPHSEPVKSVNRAKPLIPPIFPLPHIHPVETPNNLVRGHNSFIGREGMINSIRQLLHETPLLTLTGAGGVGKSRLAKEIAASVMDEYLDGVWLVKLGALADPTLVAQAVASVQGLPEEPNRPLKSTLKDYMQTKHQLLVLDNCERLKSACADLAKSLVDDCPHLRIIATSREPLGFLWESLQVVPPFSPPDPHNLPPLKDLKQNEAIRLFEDRASKKRPEFKVTNKNALAVANICRRLDGLPYAIEIAAARIRDLVTAENIDRQLTASGSSILSLEETIEWSYNSLDDLGRTLFNRLSAFAGGWTHEAAQEVCSDKKLTPAQILLLHSSLVDKSLVFGEEHGGEARYRLLQTSQEYGVEKLKASGEETEIRNQHADYYLTRAEDAELGLMGSEQGSWLALLDADHDNLRAALAWNLAQPARTEAGLRLAGALPQFWLIRGHLREGRSALEELLKAKSRASKLIRAKAIYAAGWLSWGQWEHKQAADFYEESLKLYQEEEDTGGIAWSLHDLGNVARDQGRRARARRLLERSLKLFRQIKDERGVAWSLHNLGQVARLKGEYARATNLYAESESLFDKLKDSWGRAWSLHDQGHVAKAQGDYQRATSLYEESEELFRTLGDRRGIAWSRYNLGSLAQYQCDYKRAASLYEESQSVFQKLGDKRGVAWSRFKLGCVARSQGDYGQASALINNSLSLFQELNHPRGIAETTLNLGKLAQLQGDYKRATSLYGESIERFKKQADNPGMAHAIQDLGTIAKEQGDYQEALSCYEQSLELARKIGDKYRVGWLLHDLGAVAIYQCDYERAKEYLKESLDLFKKLQDKRGTAWALHDLGRIARYQDHYDQAQTSFEQSLVIFKEVGDKRGVAWLLHDLGGVAKYKGDYERAVEYLEESLGLFQELKDTRAIAWSARTLGSVARLQKDYKEAKKRCDESLTLFRDLNEKRGIAAALYDLGCMAKEQGNCCLARKHLTESLSLFKELGDKRSIISIIDHLGGVAKEQGRDEAAVTLLSAAETQRKALGAYLSHDERAIYDHTLAALRTDLAQHRFTTAYERGQAMSLEEAITCAL